MISLMKQVYTIIGVDDEIKNDLLRESMFLYLMIMPS